MSSSSEEKAIPVATNPQLSESLQAEGECTYSMWEMLCELRQLKASSKTCSLP